jgi:transposase
VRTLRGSSLEWTARTEEEVPLRELVAVPVDVGKSSVMVMACDFTGRVLMPALGFPLTREGVARVRGAVPARTQLVRVGIEAAGHYHRPLTMPGL